MDIAISKQSLSTVSKSSTLKWREECINLLDLAEAKFSAHKESSSSLLKEKMVLEHNIASKQKEIKEIQKELNEIESENPKDPNKHILQLFKQITNITWDLQSLPNEVKGYVSNPFDVFNLNTERDSKIFIADYLWNLIGGCENANEKDHSGLCSSMQSLTC